MRKNQILIFIGSIFVLILLVSGCSNVVISEKKVQMTNETETSIINVTADVMELEDDFSVVSFKGDDYFETFLDQGGVSSDQELVDFALHNLVRVSEGLSINTEAFGCSTFSVKSPDGRYLFGRNFDWMHCNTLVVKLKPSNGYESISTVNTDFISGFGFNHLPDQMQARIASYVPLDGMNETGFVVSVNMIDDENTIQQNTNKPDLTTTTAIRLLLNYAETVEEAITLLEQYDLHASRDYMVHFAMADAQGNSAVVEYIDNKMVVVDTPVVTNFYLAEGEKYGIGTEQSHERYDMLKERLKETPEMTRGDVRDALSEVSKSNFRDFSTTEWSIVFDQSNSLVTYYHQENFDTPYLFSLE